MSGLRLSLEKSHRQVVFNVAFLVCRLTLFLVRPPTGLLLRYTDTTA